MVPEHVSVGLGQFELCQDGGLLSHRILRSIGTILLGLILHGFLEGF